jgi:hypothetical protein
MISNKKIIIGVATQKQYEFPMSDIYLPIQTGSALQSNHLGIQRDDDGLNISNLNESFCELTSLYWMWKNTKADFYGLCHHRRYFSAINGDFLSISNKKILHPDSMYELLSDYDLILPIKRSYYVETIYDHYKHGHSEHDLTTLENILNEHYPEYVDSYNTVMNGRSISLYNMFIMKSDLFNDYCEWLFNILFMMQDSIKDKDYGPYQNRVIGFIAERLLNVWVEKNQHNLKIYRNKVINIEGENLLSKGFFMVLRKLGLFKKD